MSVENISENVNYLHTLLWIKWILVLVYNLLCLLQVYVSTLCNYINNIGNGETQARGGSPRATRL